MTNIEVQKPGIIYRNSVFVVCYNSGLLSRYIWLSNCQERPPLCLFPNITGCTPVNWTDYLCRREQYSNVTVEWDIPTNQLPGTYRLVHYGHAKTSNGTVVQYTGKASFARVEQNRFVIIVLITVYVWSTDQNH